MQYLQLHPDEAQRWAMEDPKFQRLGWVRSKVPSDAGIAYDFLAYGLHANWRFIPHMMSDDLAPTSTHYEIIAGPVLNGYAELLSLSSVFLAERTLSTLYAHGPGIVSSMWIDEYNRCVEEFGRLQKNLSAATTASLELAKAAARALQQGQAESST